MKFLKLTVFVALVALSATSCKKEAENNVSKNDLIVMSGAQVVPPNSSAASAQLGVLYESRTKTLNYLIVWSGLTANASAIHVHGPADRGFTGPIIQTITVTDAMKSKVGSYSGNLFIDGVKLTENELLAGKYYVDIHTTGTFNTNGEVRGQIEFK
jgi:hypothetical protein